MSAERPAHLSDERMLLLVDDELEPRDAKVAADHLRQCAACRARAERLEASAAHFAHLYRQDRDVDERRMGATARSREGLRAQLAEINGRGRGGPSWIAACAMLAAALLALQFLSDRTGSAGSAALVGHAGIRPVSYLTPGATRPVAVADLCARRIDAPPAISAHVRQAIVREYRVEDLPAHDYELDYLITPELGGADDRRNLWPERYASDVWNARVKDELEELLPALVCAGTVPLATAQRDMATDWIAAYKKYFRTDRPLHAYSRVAPPPAEHARPWPAAPDFERRGIPALRDQDDRH